MQILMAALFITAQDWKQPKCLSSSQWINKLWHVRQMKHYLVTEGSNSWHVQHCGWISEVLCYGNGLAGAGGGGRGLTIKKVAQRNFGGAMKMTYILIVVVVT